MLLKISYKTRARQCNDRAFDVSDEGICSYSVQKHEQSLSPLLPAHIKTKK